MAFSDLVSNLDSACLSTFGNDATVVIHHKDGTADTIAPLIECNPALDDSFIPGSTDGTGTVILFLRFEDSGEVQNGDTVTLNGVDYNVELANPDREGGVKIKCRRRNQRWDR